MSSPRSVRPNGLTVECFRKLDHLESIADAWDSLVFLAGLPPLLSYAWVVSHLECCLPAGREWRCFAAFDHDQLVGVLPVILQPTAVAGRACVLLTPPRDPHMPVTGMVAAPGQEEAVATTIWSALSDEFPELFGVELYQVPQASALGRLHLPQVGGATLLKNPAGFGSYVATRGSFDDLYASLSSNVRRRLKKDRKKLNELPEISVEFMTGRDAVPELLDRFATVEAAGWKGKGGSAIGASESLMQFYRALVKRLYRRGSLEWHFLSTENRTIAGHLVVRTGRTLTLWKIGFDEDFARCSPGVMLFEQAVRNAFERDDVDGLDLISDKDWHDNWQAEKRSYLDVWLYPRRPLPILFGVLPKKARWTLRRIPGLQAIVRRVRSGGGEH